MRRRRRKNVEEEEAQSSAESYSPAAAAWVPAGWKATVRTGLWKRTRLR